MRLDLENFSGALSEESGDGGTSVAEVTIIHLKTFQVSFPQVIDSGTVYRFSDFIGIFKQKSAEFTGNCTANRMM
jgi:hypothetical protein